MKFLLIPDKFKGSLDANGVVRAVSEGILRVHSDAEIHSVLASDGGDGFLNAVSENVETESVRTQTVDPLGRDITADYLFDRATKSAYIELAKASGLELLKDVEHNVMGTSTFGTGLQIRHAIDQGAKRIYLGLGGSATNDAGIGIAKAMGYRFFDASGKELAPTGGNLGQIAAIKGPGRPEDLEKYWEKVRFYAVNDVDNPLFGERGAAHVYAKQKGASAEEIVRLDEGLRHLDRVILAEPIDSAVSGDKVSSDTLNLNNDRRDAPFENAARIPGAGAAGGTAYGLHVFLRAEFVSGIDFVLGLSQVDRLLNGQRFDYIVTGEGKFDRQTLYGKLIKGVRDMGVRFKVPVIVICGQLDVAAEKLEEFGLECVLEIGDQSKPVRYSMENAEKLISKSIAAYLKTKGRDAQTGP